MRFRAPRGVLTEERRAVLRAHRDQIVEHLRRGEDVTLTSPRGTPRALPAVGSPGGVPAGPGGRVRLRGVACHAYVELAYPELDPARAEEAWNALVARHDMLRAVVHSDGSQVVLPQVPRYRVEVAADPAEVRRELAQRVPRPDRWPLFDLRITRSPEHALLHLSLDLLIVDYASVQILLAEFDSLYADPAAPLPPLEITFRDYVLARRRMTDTARYDRDRAYWLRRMEELPPAPELPLAGAPAGGETGKAALPPPGGGAVPGAVGVAARARRPARRHPVGGAAHRVRRGDRPVEPVPALHPQPARVPAAAPAPRRARSRGRLHLRRTARRGPVRGSAVRRPRRADQRAAPGRPGAPPVHRGGGAGRAVPARRGRARADAGGLHQHPRRGAGRPGRGRVAYAVSQTPQVWIDCQAMPRGETLAVSWDVREGVLPGGLADDAFASFAGLVRRLAEDDDVWGLPGPVELPPAQAERRRRVNDTAGPLPDGLLHQGVVEQALRTPDAVAVQAPGLSLTYAELLARARAVAARLTAEGVRPAEPVAVLMDKGAEQIAGVLGTLLAGAAYLPVDTTQPAARRNTIIGDAGARVVLTQSWLADAAAPPAGCVPVAVDTLPPAPDGPVPASPAAPDDLAYVIYTSGSTGTPKGVMISHRAALNTVQDVNRRFQVTADDAVLGVASLGFDLSVYDVFGLLSAGGRLVLPDAHRRGDPSHWAELIRQTGVTVWNSVPGQMQMLHDYLRSAPEPDLPTLRLALLSGDWIPVTLPGQIRELVPGLRVISLGGATEGAIWSIFHPVAEGDASRPSIPYGTPLTNQSFHVLDAAMRDRPDWTPGELYIGGAGVARGYFADEARTAERFVTHPVTGERLYRTGDLGRYLPDGTIEFLGREDSQVKIRGYRIELAEVEAALVQHPSVAAGAVVVDAAHPAGKRLAAFVEPERRERAERAGDVPGPLIAEAAEAAASAAAPPIDPAALGDLLRALDEAALLVMEGALSRAGLFTDGAGHGAAGHNGTGYGAAGHSLDEVCDALRATARNRHIVRRWLRALTAEGRLGEDAGRYTGRLAADPGALERAWRRVEETERRVNWSPDLVEAMRACGERIDELLSGELDIRALLYPGAPSDAMTAAYRDNLAVHRLNKAVAAAVRAVAERHVGEERLRVLEVGGGVAGTTTELVPVLAEFPVEYTFTDPSQFFLNEAKERFADFPWVRYGRFDLNADPRAQGYLPNSFDVIVCANVLHNATDAAAALARLRELATPGGRLIFMENTDDENRPLLVSMEFMEVMSGPYQDVRAEGGQSFLTDEQWTRLLAEAGAELEACLPGPADPLRATGQRLFVARFKPDRARLTAGELTRHMATRLPEYMVPAHWQVVDALP
ncbi:amino acid adenylation domain-containing protein [Thermocatellispora tengchongensis]|uniref:amino acid adenylation domain-containing protein n=1 Tax=Thermocatellispora tengchongensis TaxID=1073253 RepID=UPI0036449787